MDWHRLFGLLLTDFFTGSPFVVEMEKDLSLKQQFLDVVILRKRKGRHETFQRSALKMNPSKAHTSPLPKGWKRFRC